MHEGRKRIAVLLSLAVVPTIYLSGLLAQFTRNYDAWQAGGGTVGDGTSPGLPNSNPFICLIAAFSVDGFKAFCILFIAVGFLFLMLWLRDKEDGQNYDQERNFKYAQKGTYGTAGFLSREEMKEFLDILPITKTTGTILGSLGKEVVSIPEETFMNKHIAVYGASGSMKSRSFVRNMVFQSVARGESIILTDPKSELYEDMSIYLEENGYAVRVFNLVHPECSDRWNCLGEINQDEIMAQICVEIIFSNTGDEVGKGFWDRTETNLLKALILYVDIERSPEDRNMGAVYEILIDRTAQDLENIFSVLPRTHPAKKAYSIYQKSDSKVRADTMAGLGTRLQVFQSQKICDITAADDFVFSQMGWEKCAYFVIISDQDSTFRFLSSLFFSFLFVNLVRAADDKTEERALPIGVNFILDEFPNIGMIPDFKMKISTVRSRNIRISVIFQNIAQLENRYPKNEWLEIIGNCDTQIALGCNDPMTAAFISERTGLTTIEAVSESKHLHTWRVTDYTPDYKETSSVGKRQLMNPDEILRMPMDEALIILRARNVFKVKKFDFTKHPESKKLKKRKAIAYIPKWRKEQMEAVEKESIQVIQTVQKHVAEQEKKKKPTEISKFDLMSKEETYDE